MRGKTWVVAGATLLVVFDSFLALSVINDRSSALDEARQETLALVRLVNADVTNEVGKLDRTLAGLQQVLTVRPDLLTPFNPQLSALLAERAAATPEVNAFYIFDRNGDLLAISSDIAERNINVRDRAYFRFHKNSRTGTTLISEPIRARTTGGWVIPINRRLETPEGEFLGVITTGLQPSILAETFASAVEGSGGMSLFFLSGVMGAHYPGGEALLGNDFSQTELFREYLPVASEGAWEGKAPLGEEDSIISYRVSPTLPLVAVAFISKQAKLARWHSHVWTVVVVGAACDALIVFTFLALWRQIRRRREVMRSLAIANSDLENANSDLENRVARRTAELKESEERLRAFLQVAQDAVIIIDQRGRILEFNPSAETLFGYGSAEIAGHSVNTLMPAHYAVQHDEFITHPIAKPPHSVGNQREMTGRRKDGVEFPIELTVGTHRLGGEMIHVGVIRDITARKAREVRLTRMATTDGLTGLLNRVSFLDQAESMLSQRKTGLAAVMVDADHFKRVNDTYGHAVGDIVLRELAAILAAAARADDAVGRLGGEEFALFLGNGGLVGANAVAERILQSVREKLVELPGGGHLTFTVSLGIAEGLSGDTVAAMLEHADQALYRAKQEGRDRAVTA